jgi:hypothetical protein
MSLIPNSNLDVTNSAMNWEPQSNKTALGESIVLPDLSKVQSSHSFCIDSSVCRNEVYTLGDTVNDDHNCVIAMSLGKLDNEVNANDLVESQQGGVLCKVDNVGA